MKCRDFYDEMHNHLIRMNKSVNETHKTTTKTTKHYPIRASLAPNYDIPHFKQKARSWMLRAL